MLIKSIDTNNPFYLEPPAMICFSTGRTSAFMLYKHIEAHGGVDEDSQGRITIDGSVLPNDIVVCFQNTGLERRESLEFGYRIQSEWNVNLIWLEYKDEFKIKNYITKDGIWISKRRKKFTYPDDTGYIVTDFHNCAKNREPYDNMIDYYSQYKDLIEEPRVLPNVAQRMCTAHLKIKVSNRYMKLERKLTPYDAVLGIRKDEPKRYSKMMAANKSLAQDYQNVCPLYDAGINKQEIMVFWGYTYRGVDINKDPIWEKTHDSKVGFDLELDPNSDEGNCNLCFLKRSDKIIKIMRRTKEYDDFWIDAEAKTGTVFRRDRPTYAQLREMIETNDPRLIKLEKAGVNDRVIDCICGSD